MAPEPRAEVRNVAILAHVDHGKSTLVDALVWQAARFPASGDPDAVLESLDPDRAKSISVIPQRTSVRYRSVAVNILDLPGHANFGRGVERTLGVVEGVLYVIDGREGPMPHNRHVLRRTLEAGITPIVVVNKIDLPGSRPDETVRDVRAMLADLDATPEQLEFPVIYTNAFLGRCRDEPGGGDRSMALLLDRVLANVPPPRHDPGGLLRIRVTDLDFDDFLGRLAICRVVDGSIRSGDAAARCRPDGEVVSRAAVRLFGQDGVRRVEVQEAHPGDIVSVTGIEAVAIGDTLADPDSPGSLPGVPVDEPTIAVDLAANDSPTAGIDGSHAAVADLRERLWREILTNPAIRIEDAGAPDRFTVCGRAELQLAILLEILRREGYEMLVGPPRVLTREIDGAIHEPVEDLVVDCPEAFVTIVTQKIENRRGRVSRMVNHGNGRARVEFRIPSVGLLGFRTEFLADTRRTGIANHAFAGYEPGSGTSPPRSTGVLIADRPGRATAHAIEHLQSRGTMLVGPGDEVYEGMIVGDNTTAADVAVDVTKRRRPAPVAEAGATRSTRLVPPRSMSLEQAIEFIRDDEVVEVTPTTLRLRKRLLPGSLR